MYKAKKPCKFGSRQFYIGDEIPEELIDKSRVETLVKYGVIENTPEKATEPPETETGTNTSTSNENGSEDDKQPLNGEKSTEEKQPTEKKPEPTEKKPARATKKGGK